MGIRLLLKYLFLLFFCVPSAACAFSPACRFLEWFAGTAQRTVYVRSQFLASPIRIWSTGQTGVARAALDIAHSLHFERGGFCPADRRAQDGQIPAEYPLQETAFSGSGESVERNVQGSDGTLVLTWGVVPPGSWIDHAIRWSREHSKPFLVVDMRESVNDGAIRDWLRDHSIATLHVAGPPETAARGYIASSAQIILLRIFAQETVPAVAH